MTKKGLHWDSPCCQSSYWLVVSIDPKIRNHHCFCGFLSGVYCILVTNSLHRKHRFNNHKGHGSQTLALPIVTGWACEDQGGRGHSKDVQSLWDGSVHHHLANGRSVVVNSSFCANRTWREYSRRWTRTHKNSDDSLFSDRCWQQVSKMIDNKDSLNEIPFFVKTHMHEITQMCTDYLALSQKIKRIKRSALTGSCLWHEKELWQSTRLSQQTRQVAEMAQKWTPSQKDVVFVVMGALVTICEDDLIAMRSVTAIPKPYALGLSCPNQLTAN